MRRTMVAVIALVLAIIAVRLWLLDSFTVGSDSMSPTLCTGDVLLVRTVSDRANLRNGDIVVFTSPEDGRDTVKRIVALPGQKVAIVDAQLVVDGQPVPEAYVDLASIDAVYFGPVAVPDDTVFVMGDHREISVDSRAFGPVPRSAVHDKLWLRLGGGC